MAGAESREGRETNRAVRGVETSSTETGNNEKESGGAGDAVALVLVTRYR